MRDLIVRTYREFSRDGGSRLSAALAYYALFALTPAMLLSVSVAAAIADQASVDVLLEDSLTRLLGPAFAGMLMNLAETRSSAYHYETAWVALMVLFVSSVLALKQVQAAFNRMWSVDLRDGTSVWRVVRARLLQATIALVPAVMLLAGVLANSIASALASRPVFSQFEGWVQVLGSPSAVLVSSALAFLVFFKYLPDVFVPWRAALASAAGVAVAWVVGTYLFGLYVGQAALDSVYGAAGSAFVLLIWLNYSARVVLVGCKSTKMLAERTEGFVRPRPYAVRVEYSVFEETDTVSGV